MGNVYTSSKVMTSEGLGWKREYSMCGGKYWKLYTVLSYRGVVYLLYMYFKMSCVYCCYLSCVYCCSCVVCIVVILCVFAVLFVYCCFYFRCRTAGYKSIFRRFCERQPRHRFFLVSLCLSKCWDGSQDSKLPLHASHVALQT